jgi:hypothetical protein
MKRTLVLWATLLLALFSARTAQAADITVLDRGDGDLPAIVTVKGYFDLDDDQKFIQATAGIPKAIVYLEGPGGEITPGLNIGLAIRNQGFETAVAGAKTCSSACALAWLAGSPRRMGEGSNIGFHAAWIESRGADAPSGTGNAFVGYYAHQLGLTYDAVRYITMAEPSSMSWLTPQDAHAYNIHYDALTREQADRYAAATAPAPQIAHHVAVAPECDAIRDSLKRLVQQARSVRLTAAEANSAMLLTTALSECLRKRQ